VGIPWAKAAITRPMVKWQTVRHAKAKPNGKSEELLGKLFTRNFQSQRPSGWRSGSVLDLRMLISARVRAQTDLMHERGDQVIECFWRQLLVLRLPVLRIWIGIDVTDVEFGPPGGHLVRCREG
jgi:hypothetical protein